MQNHYEYWCFLMSSEFLKKYPEYFNISMFGICLYSSCRTLGISRFTQSGAAGEIGLNAFVGS
jgi:hypothetical protein